MLTIQKTGAKVPGDSSGRGQTRAQGTNVIRNWQGGSVIGFQFHRLRARATYDRGSTMWLNEIVFWMMGVLSPYHLTQC